MSDRLLRRVPAPLAALLDAGGVGIFAAIGRRSHTEPGGALALLGTAWPFLAGAGIGWLIQWAWRRQAPVDFAAGLVVWVCTVAGGMTLRALTGAGTALSFVLVTSAVTAAILLGWRVAAKAIQSRRDVGVHA